MAPPAVITETAPVDTASVIDFPSFGLDVLVRQFDPALGTLTGVSASLTSQFTPSIFVEYSTIPLPPTALHSRVGVAGVGVNRFSEISPFVMTAGGQIAVGAPEPVDITATQPLAGFTGSGSYNFYVTGGTDLVYNNLGGGAIDRSVLKGQLAVTYTYTPGTAVPEPASLALIAVGLLGLCAFRPGRSVMRGPSDQLVQ